MNSKIKELNKKLNNANQGAAEIEKELQKEWNKVFDDSAKLKKAIADAECASLYQLNEDGEVESWWRYRDLLDIPEDAREYFETWISEYGITVNWDDESLMEYGLITNVLLTNPNIKLMMKLTK
jgi:hypothetical protein